MADGMPGRLFLVQAARRKRADQQMGWKMRVYGQDLFTSHGEERAWLQVICTWESEQSNRSAPDGSALEYHLCLSLCITGTCDDPSIYSDLYRQ